MELFSPKLNKFLIFLCCILLDKEFPKRISLCFYCTYHMGTGLSHEHTVIILVHGCHMSNQSYIAKVQRINGYISVWCIASHGISLYIYCTTTAASLEFREYKRLRYFVKYSCAQENVRESSKSYDQRKEKGIESND